MIQVWCGTAVLCVTSSTMNVPVSYMYNTGFLSLAYFFCMTRLLIANKQPCEDARRQPNRDVRDSSRGRRNLGSM